MKTHQLKQVLYLAYSHCPSFSRLRYLRFLRVKTKLPVSVGSAPPNLNSVHLASIPYLHAAILGTAWVQEWWEEHICFSVCKFHSYHPALYHHLGLEREFVLSWGVSEARLSLDVLTSCLLKPFSSLFLGRWLQSSHENSSSSLGVSDLPPYEQKLT